jgi:hypothetical protein
MNPLSPEIDSCDYLFLREIQEERLNRLRLVVVEGVASDVAVTEVVAGVAFDNCRSIEIVPRSRIFDISWDWYVSYSVRNESFITMDETEKISSGKRVRIYSKSHFLEYIARATFACEKHPGPMHHVEVVCQDHVIDVISTKMPVIKRVGLEGGLN